MSVKLICLLWTIKPTHDWENIYVRQKKSSHGADVNESEDALEYPGSRHTFYLFIISQ